MMARLYTFSRLGIDAGSEEVEVDVSAAAIYERTTNQRLTVTYSLISWWRHVLRVDQIAILIDKQSPLDFIKYPFTVL